MEPNTVQPSEAPGSEPGSKPGPFTRKSIIIAVAALIVCGIGLFLLLGKQGSKGTSDASLYIKRDGYERNDAVGDPTGLTSAATSQVVQFGGQNVLQPCALLTLQDLIENGLKLNAGLAGAVERSYFDGVGQGTNLRSRTAISLPFSKDSNQCAYTFENRESVDVIAYQPSYIEPLAVQYTLGRQYDAVADMQGLKAYKKRSIGNADRGEHNYILRSSNGDVEIRLKISNEEAQGKLLQLIATRVAKAQTAPTPVQSFSYKSPIFEAKSLSSCNLIDNAFFKAVHAVDAGPLLYERFYSSINVVEQNEQRFNYTSYECERMAEEGNRHRTVRISADSYETEEGAKQAFAFKKTSPLTSEVQEVSPQVGDESFYGNVSSADNAIVFRKGNVIASVSYFVPSNNDQITPEQRIQTLAPLLQSALQTRWQLK